MNMNFLALYCALSFINVVIQTVKSLCTVKCSTFISACVNALAYGLYVYVIFLTNAEGLPLWGKAIIVAVANFTGVYIANMLFNKMFSREVGWVVSVSVPNEEVHEFMGNLYINKLTYHDYGWNSDCEYSLFTVYCPTSKDSANLKKILPVGSKYNISESVKRL